MPVTNYDCPKGDVLGETTGSQATTYMSDALGSTIGTIQNGAVVNRYVYSPYGRQISKTGTGADPKFLFVGQHGYRATNRQLAEEYVEQRHLSTSTSRWTTIDQLWPYVSGYTYVNGRPTTAIDPTGIWIIIWPTFRSVDSTAFGNCGSFDVWWGYHLLGDFTGWLIQHVTMTQSVTMCNAANVPHLCCNGANSCGYYEAWLVIHGKLFIPDGSGGWGIDPSGSRADHFQYGPDKPCSSGSAEYKGEMYLLSMPKPGLVPPGFHWPQGWACAGGLPIMDDGPTGSGWVRAPFWDGHASTIWGCCYSACGPENCACSFPGTCMTAKNYP